MSPEAIAKIKIARSITSDETRRRMSESHKGHYWSEEARAKLSATNKGRKAWNAGIKTKPHTTESRLLMSRVVKARLAAQGFGGKSDWKKKIRDSIEYRMWREAVFKRDNYTCQFCGQHGGYLEADHIKSFKDHPELWFVVPNGRTLCRACHKKTPSWGRQKKSNA